LNNADICDEMSGQDLVEGVPATCVPPACTASGLPAASHMKRARMELPGWIRRASNGL
jgi:hypothetical protein